MSLIVPGAEWRAKTLRAWQLAILRFAVTLDNADRLAVMAIAGEIDRLGHDSKPDFSFFAGPVRSYAPPFKRRMNLAPWSCVNTSRGLTMTASSTSSPQHLKLINRSCLRSANLLNATMA